MNWTYVNPFWHSDYVMASSLSPDDCRRRLKAAGTESGSPVVRERLARGDATYHKPGYRLGPLLELHVRVTVSAAEGGGSRLRLRFSGGIGTAVVQATMAVGGLAAFVWALAQLAGGSRWDPIYGAALLSILIPALTALALRSSEPGDRDDLWQFIADQVDGKAAR